MNDHSFFLQSGSAKLFCTDIPADFPNAQTMIFLHGNSEEQGYFEHQVSFFRGKYRLVLMDSRGHGKSSCGNKPFDFTLFSKDLLHLMDYLHIEQAHLLGFSDGGNLALTFALFHPSRVSSLILNGANLSPSGVKFSVQFPTVLSYGMYSLLSPFSDKAALCQKLYGLMVNHPHISAEKLRSIHIPSMVIVGEHDMIKDSHSRLIARSLPCCRFVSLEGADHFCAAGAPDAFNQQVERFLARL